MKRTLQFVAIFMLGMFLSVAGLVGIAGLTLAQTPNGIHGAFNGPLQLPSVFKMVFGDNVSSDVALQKTAANILTVSNGILSMPYAGGTITTNGTAIAAGVCQAQTAVTVNGLTAGGFALTGYPTGLPASWQTGISVKEVVTANTITPNLCNGTAGSITPAATAITLRAFN